MVQKHGEFIVLVRDGSKMAFDIGKAKRKIDGKWFTLHSMSNTKRSAVFEAKAWRMKRGTPARVTAYSYNKQSFWAVWVK